MSIDEVMKKHGLTLSASCAGRAFWTKWLKYQGKRAYITVTDLSGESFPTTLTEPVRVAIYELRSGDELGPPQDFPSLSSFLENLETLFSPEKFPYPPSPSGAGTG